MFVLRVSWQFSPRRIKLSLLIEKMMIKWCMLHYTYFLFPSSSVTFNIITIVIAVLVNLAFNFTYELNYVASQGMHTAHTYVHK